jgi:hypothetical protein
MEITRSASCPSFTPNESHAKPMFGRLRAANASRALGRSSAEADDGAVHVALSPDGLAHAWQHVSHEAEPSDPWALSDMMCWLIAIGLGIIMGWSAAGQLLS